MRSLVRFQLAPLARCGGRATTRSRRPPRLSFGRRARRSGRFASLTATSWLGEAWEPSRTLAAVKMFRRVLLVLGVAGAIGAVARVRGKGEVVATEGGWRELDGPEFR